MKPSNERPARAAYPVDRTRPCKKTLGEVRKNMQKSVLSTLIALAFTVIILGCDSRGQQTNADETSESIALSDAGKDAFMALKKLQSAVETGVSFRDFQTMIVEANFPVNIFLESNDAKQAEDFSRAIQEAMNWYITARNIWQIKIENGHALVFSGTSTMTSWCESFRKPLSLRSKGQSLGERKSESIMPYRRHGSLLMMKSPRQKNSLCETAKWERAEIEFRQRES